MRRWQPDRGTVKATRSGWYHRFMTTESGSLSGHLLIAMPGLTDPNFHQAVVLLGAHSAEDGAFGVVVNQSLGMSLEAVLDEIGEPVPSGALPEVMSGGPVETSQGFVLFEDDNGLEIDETLRVDSGVALSGSTEVLSRLVRGHDHYRFYLLLGYAGWHPGQLEQEIEENAWLVAPLDRDVLFETPVEERWIAALRTLGVDPGTLVDTGGWGQPS